MKYLMLIKHEESLRSATVPESLYAAMGEFVTEAMQSGKIIDTAGLKPTSAAWSVKMGGRKLTVVDGPFAESKEIVGGYALADLKTMAEARELAQKFMQLHLEHWPDFEGACEVRPLEDEQPC
ncbi:MAG: YciI family protein [Gemmatimonadaceae bacterium]